MMFHDAPEIRVDLPSEFIGGHLLECADEAVVGVVHEDIYATEGLGGRSDGLFGLARQRDIQLYRAKAVAVGFGEINQLFWSARGGDDFVTRLKCCFCESSTEAARTARNKPNF